MADVRIFVSSGPPTSDDVRALKEFLESENVGNEKALQALFQAHPPLIGVLGFSEFIAEYPLIKIDSRGEAFSGRRPDRADFVAAKPSALMPAPYRSTHLIELKRADCDICSRDVGFRLSMAASSAVQQLHEYRDWLTRAKENRTGLESLGWEIAWPSLFLVMGRDREFAPNPSQLEEVRSRLVDQGVHMFTTDDILAMASRQVESRIWTPGATQWVFGSALSSATSPHLASVLLQDGERPAGDTAPPGFSAKDLRADAFFVDTGYIIDLISFRPGRGGMPKGEFHVGASLIWHEYMARKVRRPAVSCYYSAFVLQELIDVISRILFQTWKNDFADAPELKAAIGDLLSGEPELASDGSSRRIPPPLFLQKILPFIQGRLGPLLARMTRVPDQAFTLEDNAQNGWSMQQFLEIAPFAPADCQLLATVLGSGAKRFVTNDHRFRQAAAALMARFGLEIVSY
jgi:hypothetical protein